VGLGRQRDKANRRLFPDLVKSVSRQMGEADAAAARDWSGFEQSSTTSSGSVSALCPSTADEMPGGLSYGKYV
jgi:hypothetical protein